MIAAAIPPGRIVGLDAWRALLIAGGLFVHASFRLAPTALSTAVETASTGFRMGAFFAISGFFAGLILPRRAPLAWLRGRLVNLGTPALFGMVVLSPLVWAMVEWAPATPGRLLLPYEWHHLWFLFALIPYSVIAVALEQADRRFRWLARLDALVGEGAASGRIAMLTVALTGAALFGLAPRAMHAWLAPHHVVAFANLQSIAGYLPMFLFGGVLARCPRLRAAVFGAWRVAVAVTLLGAIGVVAMSVGVLGDTAFQYMRFVLATTCPPAVFGLILRAAFAVRQVPRFVQRVADASYTIYLLHLPVAVAFNVTIGRLLEPTAAYLLCVLVAGIASYAAHRLAARHLPALLLVLNGRRPQPA